MKRLSLNIAYYEASVGYFSTILDLFTMVCTLYK